MDDEHSVMLMCSIADAQARFAAWLAQVEAGEPVLIDRHGVVVAALIGVAEWQPFLDMRTDRRGLLGLLDAAPASEALAEAIDGIVAARSAPRPLPAME
jgi:prevent-host-death family protein